MHRNTLRLSPLTLSLAIAAALGGCANLPTHDGSLRSVYGMDQPESERYARVETTTTPVENTPLQQANKQVTSELPSDPNTPVVRTLNNGASLVSQPMQRPPQFSEQTTLAPQDDVPLTNDSQSGMRAAATAAVATPIEMSAEGNASVVPVQPVNSASQITSATPVSGDRVVRHTVGNTDTLSSIAEQYTGDAGQWRYIAEFNGLPKPYSIRVGDELIIPDETVPAPLTQQASSKGGIRLPLQVVPPTRTAETRVSGTASASAAATTARTASTSTSSSPATNMAMPSPEVNETATATSPSVAPAVQSSNRTSDTTVAAADLATDAAEETQVGGFRERLGKLTALVKTGFRKPDAEVIEETDADVAPADIASAPSTPASDQATVRVTGDFTPKAVYKAPDYASGLLMRVAPGATFETSGQDGDWVAITTDQGSGYIFHRDVQVVQ